MKTITKLVAFAAERYLCEWQTFLIPWGPESLLLQLDRKNWEPGVSSQKRTELSGGEGGEGPRGIHRPVLLAGTLVKRSRWLLPWELPVVLPEGPTRFCEFLQMKVSNVCWENTARKDHTEAWPVITSIYLSAALYLRRNKETGKSGWAGCGIFIRKWVRKGLGSVSPRLQAGVVQNRYLQALKLSRSRNASSDVPCCRCCGWTEAQGLWGSP